MTTGREAENFLSAVTGKQQTDNKPHDAVNGVRVTIESVHARERGEMHSRGQAATILS